MPPASGVPVPGGLRWIEAVDVERRVGRAGSGDPPRLGRGEAPALVVELVHAEHTHAAVAREAPHVWIVGGAADPDLDHPGRIQHTFFHRAAEWRAVVKREPR